MRAVRTTREAISLTPLYPPLQMPDRCILKGKPHYTLLVGSARIVPPPKKGGAVHGVVLPMNTIPGLRTYHVVPVNHLLRHCANSSPIEKARGTAPQAC